MEITTFGETIWEFKGEYAFLSNFYRSGNFIENMMEFKTVEHYYQACKCKNTGEANIILNCDTPGEAKKLGRSVELKPNWERIKDHIMRNALLLKFSQHTDLKRKLIQTGDAILVEGNYWGDEYWGYCLKKKKGENHLGKFLMELRKILKDYPYTLFNI